MIRNGIAYNFDTGLTITRGEGSYLWDERGRKILDFSSGWNVVNIGWNHPEISAAMVEQIRKNVYVSIEMGEEIQYRYAEALLGALPKELNVVSRVTGGTEANEQAIKIARASTGRKKIIGFFDTYHGESLGDLAISYRKEYVTKISPLVPEFIQMQFPTAALTNTSDKETLDAFVYELENVLKNRDVAALVAEPGIVTGWGSMYVAPQGFLTAIRRITERYGTLLILDEVGTGFSRTGKLFGMHHENVVPDIATFAKGISNGGAAIGALAVKRDIIEPVQADTMLISTFGWTPVACAAALATLRVHVRDKMWEQSEQKGEWLKQELHKRLKGNPAFGGVRGMGMEIGLICIDNHRQPDINFADEVCRHALKNDLYLSLGDVGCIQLMPPLTTSQNVLAEGVRILVESIDRVTNMIYS